MGILDGFMSKGLLGMGGVQGAMGGNGVPQGLLEAGYDPAQLRKMQIKRALLQGGAAMMAQGPSQYPISFAQQLGTGLSAGLLGADQAREDYTQQTLLGAQLQDKKAERARQAKQDAWTNTANARQMSEWDEQDAAKKQKRDFLTKTLMSPLTGVPVQNMGQANMYSQMGDYDAAAQALMQQPQVPQPTDDMREYNMAVSQGYKGTLQDYMIAMKKAGASTTNIDMKGQGAFEQELGKGLAGAYNAQIEAGQNAVNTKTAAQQLRVLMKNNSGTLTGLGVAVAPYLPEGAIPQGVNDAVAAQAIVAGLIPKQRVPGSGTTSDFDAKKFMESLPSVWNKPGSNELILNTMEAYADYQMMVGNIVADIGSNPDIKNKSQAIREEVAQIPDPFANWKKYMAQSGKDVSGTAGGQTSTGLKWSVAP